MRLGCLTTQSHYVVAVALKAYSIQALMAHVFDMLIILLGNFHIQLTFLGAIGTYVSESGLECIID